MVGVFKISGDHQEALRVGVALELNAHAAPHRAPSPISANQVVALQAQRLALLLGHQLHLVSRLGDRFNLGIEQDLHMGQFGQLVLDGFGQLPLLALQPERVLGIVLEQIHVEFGDHALSAVALLRVASHQALRHDGLRQAIAGQHVQGWRVEGRSAQVHAQTRRAFKHRYRNASLAQNQGADHANRAGTSNQDVGFHQIVLQTKMANCTQL